MTKQKSVLSAKAGHGGRRPGAGAPKGNLNGLRHGLNSPRFYKAALMIAVVPELRLLFHSLQRADDRKERQRYLRLLAAARHATAQDPDLAGAIKALVLDRLEGADAQIRGKALLLDLLNSQSSNQDDRDGPLGHRGAYSVSRR